MSKSRTAWFLALSLLAAANAVQAQDAAPAAAPSIDRPLRIGVGLGLGIGAAGGAQFVITEEVDYRFLPSEIGNFFIGVALGEGIGSTFLFQGGVRAGYDFRIFHENGIEILVAPEIVLGAAFADVQGVAGWFDLQIGAEGRVVLLDGLLGFWLRPLAFDIFIGERTFARYDLLAGASVQL